MRPFPPSATFTPFVSRTFLVKFSSVLSWSFSIGKLHHLAGTRDEYTINLEPELDSKENALQISTVILNIRNITVDNVVQALKHDEFCSKCQPTSNLVEVLLHKFKDDWKSALGIFHWAKMQSGYKHNTSSFEMMVDILGKMKQMNQMLDIVKEMQKVSNVTLETIAKVMRRLVAAKKWGDAIDIFDDMGSFGLEKNTDTMNLLLDTLCKEKKVEVARDVYLKLKDQIIPDKYTFNILVSGWCNSRRMDEAMWTIEEMKDHGFHPSVVTYTTILKAYCKQSKFSKAYDVLDEMITSGSPPNIVTYTTMMSYLVRSYKPDKALSIVDKMKVYGCKPDTVFYNCLINTLGKLGKVQEAYQVFGFEMQNEGVNRNSSTYNTMISLLCTHSREQEALDVLKEMENSDLGPDILTYYPLLKLYFKTKKIDQIKALLNDIVFKHRLCLDLDAYTLLIHGFYSLGEIEWACNLLDEMTCRDIIPRIHTLNLIMDEACQKRMDGRVEKIKNLIEQIKVPSTKFC